MKDERTLEEMLEEQVCQNRCRSVEAKHNAFIHGTLFGDEVAVLMLVESRDWWVSARTEELMRTPPSLFAEDADEQACLEFVKLRQRRDPFVEFGIYSGLTEPMKPRPW